jgi:5-methylcytosine-specific restriction enzyme subunit McrC
MNAVFEDFVSVALREALALTARVFPRHCAGRRLALDTASKVRLQPDLSWWEGGRCVFAGDIKYKRTDQGEHADLYQLLAYATAARLSDAVLVYASSDGPAAVHEVAHGGVTLHVTALDLTAPPDQLLKQVDTLAHRVRRLRARVPRARAA